MDAAELIRQTVTVQDVARQYGLTPNRAGFIKCPFHTEHTASLKLYPGGRGWHCFGCGRGGSVIDFVKEYQGVGFLDALQRIDAMFGLGLPLRKKADYRERERLRRQFSGQLRKAQEQTRERQRTEREYDALLNEYVRLDLIRTYLRPQKPEDLEDSLYAYAVGRLPVIEYKLDTLEVGQCRT